MIPNKFPYDYNYFNYDLSNSTDSKDSTDSNFTENLEHSCKNSPKVVNIKESEDNSSEITHSDHCNSTNCKILSLNLPFINQNYEIPHNLFVSNEVPVNSSLPKKRKNNEEEKKNNKKTAIHNGNVINVKTKNYTPSECLDIQELAGTIDLDKVENKRQLSIELNKIYPYRTVGGLLRHMSDCKTDADCITFFNELDKKIYYQN